MRRHNNWDRSRSCHGRFDRYGKMGNNYIDTKPDKFFSELFGAVASQIGVTKLNPDVLTFRIAESMQPPPERFSERVGR